VAPAAEGKAHVAAVKIAATDPGERHGAVPDHAEGGICLHGHCHHGSAAKPFAEASEPGAAILAARPPIPVMALPNSHLRYGFDRPPRA
jgi:hypothetical protein